MSRKRQGRHRPVSTTSKTGTRRWRTIRERFDWEQVHTLLDLVRTVAIIVSAIGGDGGPS